jgi:hypothetical protein
MESISKGNPFGVPDAYFDTFSARLNRRLEQRNTARMKVPGGSLFLLPGLFQPGLLAE